MDFMLKFVYLTPVRGNIEAKVDSVVYSIKFKNPLHPNYILQIKAHTSNFPAMKPEKSKSEKNVIISYRTIL